MTKSENNTLGFKDVIDDIAMALEGADGDYIQKLHNEICSGKVRYIGDSMYVRLPDIQESDKDRYHNLGWYAFEADDLPGMWDWTGPQGQCSDQSFPSEEEALDDMIRKHNLKELLVTNNG